CPSRDTDFLTADLLLVELPDRTYIDVSWQPEHDPDGAFFVTVYLESWDHELVSFDVKDISEVVQLVEQLARNYGAPVGPRDLRFVRRTTLTKHSVLRPFVDFQNAVGAHLFGLLDELRAEGFERLGEGLLGDGAEDVQRARGALLLADQDLRQLQPDAGRGR